MIPDHRPPVSLPVIADPQLRASAFTHRSYSHDHPDHPHYERLEFLGDAVLGFLIAHLLYLRYPDYSEAELTRLRSQLVNQTSLAQVAQALAIAPALKLGRGMERNGGRENPSILSDVVEAVIGAVLLDQGLEAATVFVEGLFTPILEQMDQGNTIAGEGRPVIDPKGRLQQWALNAYQQLPEYVLVREWGPDHAKMFVFAVKIGDIYYGQGQGPSKQEATKQAAIATLRDLERREIQRPP